MIVKPSQSKITWLVKPANKMYSKIKTPALPIPIKPKKIP